MIRTIVLVAAVGSLAFYIGYAEGQMDVKLNTTVSSGHPYYEGVYYGECEKVPGRQSCAHDRRRNMDGSPASITHDQP